MGSLVRVGSPPVYAIVEEIWHEPRDPSRPLATRGADLESEDEIYASNPQFVATLTTRFSASVVGHRRGSELRLGLPDQPPRLHSFVFLGDNADMEGLAQDMRWLRLLLAKDDAGSDAAVAAFVRRVAGVAIDRREFLVRAGKCLAAELAGDPRRLQALLREMTQ